MNYFITLLLFLDCLEGDEDEPDLPLLSTLDFAALKDVRETGEEYCRSFTKLLHETPGLQPGYLPQTDALYLLSGVSIKFSVFVNIKLLTCFGIIFQSSLFSHLLFCLQAMHMLTLGSYLEEHAAKLCREALG